MIVCSCNVISDSKIKASLDNEACPRTPAAVYRCLGCSPNCGRCFATVRLIISQALSEGKDAAECCEHACTAADAEIL
jgi:bacterioferritin-associated ferredoxin